MGLASHLGTPPHTSQKLYLPFPAPDVESYVRDTIYDPYIRRIVLESFLGKWKDKLDDATSCSSVLRSRARWRAAKAKLNAHPLLVGEEGPGYVQGWRNVDNDHLCPHAWARSKSTIMTERSCPLGTRHHTVRSQRRR
ncbi:hypothetical protein V8E55_006839 [Tylopilus felleus]